MVSGYLSILLVTVVTLSQFQASEADNDLTLTSYWVKHLANQMLEDYCHTLRAHIPAAHGVEHSSPRKACRAYYASERDNTSLPQVSQLFQSGNLTNDLVHALRVTQQLRQIAIQLKERWVEIPLVEGTMQFDAERTLTRQLKHFSEPIENLLILLKVQVTQQTQCDNFCENKVEYVNLLEEPDIYKMRHYTFQILEYLRQQSHKIFEGVRSNEHKLQ